jgi:hypothetical protein
MTEAEELSCRDSNDVVHQKQFKIAHHGDGGQVGYLSAKTISNLKTLKSVWLKVTYALNGDSLGVDGAQVGVLKEGDKVCLNGLLKSADGR